MGALPGHASTTVHIAAIASTMPITRLERCHGWRVMTRASSGPATIRATTMIVSSAPAAAGDNPSPRTKNGYPHSRPIVVALNWVVKCIQKPSRVPG